MELENYTEDEFDLALYRIMRNMLFEADTMMCRPPRAVLLGGQSGAGKTSLHEILAQEMREGVVVINGDEYRSQHPRFYELEERYGMDAVAHTAAWAGHMTESLIDLFSLVKYNLVVEGTLRTAQVPLDTAALLRNRGYGVSLALMAVKPDISLISCQIRYELMKEAGTTPRATDPAHHNAIVADIVSNLVQLEESALFDEIRLYARGGKLLHPREGDDRTASEVLGDVLFGDWTAEERRHYAFLQEKLAGLKRPSRGK